MKNRFILILFSIALIGCKQNQHSDKTTIADSPIEKLSTWTSELSPTNGVFHKNDIDENLVLVFDTITSSNYCRWKGINAKSIKGYFKINGDFHFKNYKYLKPNRTYGKQGENQKHLYQVDSTQYFVAMNCEEAITNYISWVEVAKDSVKFVSCLSPNIDTKNAYTKILKHFYKDEHLHLISKLEGAEGGENWESIWISKVDKDVLVEVGKVEIGYIHDEGDWAKLNYAMDENEIKIYEERKQMKLIDNEWKQVKSNRKLMKSIQL